MTHVDQLTRRRMARTGLTALDEIKACPGYILYSPIQSRISYLIDLEGTEIHRWDFPYPPGLYGYLLPNGNLFYIGQIRDETWGLMHAWNQVKGGVLMEVDWTGNVVWEHRDPFQHHDARRTTSGGAIYLAVERIPEEIAAQVKGGIPGSDKEGMWADIIVEVDAKGQRIWEWHAYEHLNPKIDILPPNVHRSGWSHGNTVVPLGNNRVLVSFRNISTVGIIDKESGQFVWKLGGDILAQQHDPSMLSNGNVLIFDNGQLRKNITSLFSRVIEVDPISNEIVWEYQDSPPINFFSSHISGARRLFNGNTLITEGFFGRMFQVTLEGEVVWEYINPHFQETDGSSINYVFRANHYAPQEIPSLI